MVAPRPEEDEWRVDVGGRIAHAWAAPGTYRVSVTVTTLSCVHGQEDVTATAEVVVR